MFLQELYYEQCDSACIMFACIKNFTFLNKDSTQDILILNDIISNFDLIVNNLEFKGIEKIKSTGPVYIAASGMSISNY